jgi:hypothetical protein
MEVLQLEYMKSQCKLNNDYKSLAAVARLQRNTVLNAQNNYHSHKEIFFNSRNITQKLEVNDNNERPFSGVN